MGREWLEEADAVTRGTGLTRTGGDENLTGRQDMNIEYRKHDKT